MTGGEPIVERRAGLATDAAKLWGAALIEQLLAFARGVILPRYLGPGLYGILGGLGLITKYGSYLQLGLTTALGREVPFALAAGARARADRLARAVFSFNLLTSTVPALGLAAFALATWGRYRVAVSWGLLIFAFLLVTSRCEVLYRTLFRARRQFGSAFAFVGLKAIVLFALVIGLLFAYGLFGVFAGLVIGGSLFMLIGSAWTRVWASPWPDWRLVKELLPIGLPLAALGVLGFLLQSADRLLVIRFLAARDLGHYMLAVTVVTFVYFLPMNVGQAMAPRIYALRRDGDLSAFGQFLVKPSLFITYFVAAIGGMVVLTLIPFIRYVLPAYGPTVPVAAALLVGITCQGGAQGAGHILIALGRFKSIAAAQLGGLAVGVAVMLAALHRGWGLPGVAAGSSAGLAVFACAVQLLAWRAIGLPARTIPNAFAYLLVPPAVVAAALVGAFYGGTTVAGAWAPALGQPLGDLVTLAARLVLFVPAVLLFGILVERQTGFARQLWAMFKEKLSPPGP